MTRLKFTKMKTVLCAVSAVFLASIFGAFPSEAKTAFDPSYYFEKYVDVANEYGFDTQALFNHYQTAGMQEGRFPNRESEWKAAAGYVATQEERTAFMMQIPSPNPENANSDLPKFDPIYYYNNYPDVAAVIGPDAIGLLNHYFAYGYSEARLPYYGAEPCTDVQTSF